MSKRFGIAYIKVTGHGLLATMPGAQLEMGGVERTPVMQGSKLIGFSEQGMPARVTCEISVGADDYVAEIARIVNETVTFECDTGNTYVVANAFCAKPPVLKGAGSSGDGNYTLELVGSPAVELGHLPADPTGRAEAY